MVQDPNGKWIHFGAMGYEDYTKHKDDKRKQIEFYMEDVIEDMLDSMIGKETFWEILIGFSWSKLANKYSEKLSHRGSKRKLRLNKIKNK